MDTNASSGGTAACLPGKLTHDLNNVLASILCYGTLLRRDTQGIASAAESVEEIMALARRAKQMLAATQEAAGGEMPAGRGERILVVDDEPALLTAVARVLRELGYRVTPLQRSPEARDLFLRDPYAYDLLLLDQTMPELTGLELAAGALGARPTLPVIITTGYTARLDSGKARELGVAAVLEKPATSEVIASTVRSVLDSRG